MKLCCKVLPIHCICGRLFLWCLSQ